MQQNNTAEILAERERIKNLGSADISEQQQMSSPTSTQYSSSTSTSVNPTSVVARPEAIAAQEAETLSINNPTTIETQTYQADTIGSDNAAKAVSTPESTAQAAIGNLPPEALISSQMEELTKSLENNDETPIWARGAVDAVEAQLAARGLTRSSIGQSALTNAIVQAAMPIAQGNAQAVQTSFSQNVNNRQQANILNAQQGQQIVLSNLKTRHDVMLSDQSATNASRQMNANSVNQTNQFMSSLKTQVDLNNASRSDAMSQFNSNQVNTSSQFNVVQRSAIDQFNSNLEFNTSKFNAENSTLISQANLNWRRQANLQDTASENQANLMRVQNNFAVTKANLDEVWQQARDSASWAFQASQNDNQIKASLIKATMDNDTQKAIGSSSAKSSSYSAIGSAAFGIAKEVGLFSSIGKSVTSFFGS